MKSSSGSLAKMACVAAAAVALCVPIAARAANPMYLVYLNPFEVQRQEEMARNAGYSPLNVPLMLREGALESYIASNMDSLIRSEGANAVRRDIVRSFALRDVEDTPLPIPAFYARLSDEEVQALNKSEKVVSVDRVHPERQDVVFSAGYWDYVSNNEIIPWGKQAVGADDGITVNNARFFLIDAAFYNPALGNEINFAYTDSQPGDALQPGDTEDSYRQNHNHVAAVLSLATGKANSRLTRGINPGQPVVHFGMRAFSDADIAEKVYLAASMAEWMGQFSTLNISMNQKPGYANMFSHDSVVGKAIRRASARLFVTQSAGNHDTNACRVSFNHNGAADPNDGVMVVAGTNRFGDRYPETPNPDGVFATESRTNYGPCVEAWAPGSEMTVSLQNGSIESVTGTSFAAPIVAAIAGRYGNSATRPIEREAYIRDTLTFTGKYEGARDSNLPIRQVKYKPVPSVRIPFRLPVVAVYSKTHTANLQNLVNGKFYDGMDWNAHGGWGSIVLDLGSPRNIRGVRVMIRSSSDGGVLNFAVHGGNAISMLGNGRAEIPANPIAYKNTTDQFDLTPYYIPASGNYRYIMLEAANMASWLSYSEVEVYGY